MLLSHQWHRGTEDMPTHPDARTQQDTKCSGLPLYNPCSVLAEPQNHRMTELGRDPWKSSGPTPFFKQGHVKPAAWNYVQKAFQYLQRGSLHKLWPSCARVGILTVQKCFLMFSGNLLCFSLGPLPLVLMLGTLKRAWLHPLCTCLADIYIHW